jgi:ferredoxin-thioredoxin reductase catalytic chain
MNNEEKILNENYASYANKQRYRLNPNKNIVKAIIGGLLRNKEKKGELYCPCRIVSGDKEKDKDIICPCIFHKKEIEEMGHCHCFLFVK